MSLGKDQQIIVQRDLRTSFCFFSSNGMEAHRFKSLPGVAIKSSIRVTDPHEVLASGGSADCVT